MAFHRDQKGGEDDMREVNLSILATAPMLSMAASLTELSKKVVE